MSGGSVDEMTGKGKVMKILTAATLIGCLLPSGCSEDTSASQSAGRIVVLCAFTPELEALLEKMDVNSTDVLCGRTCHIGVLGGKDAVLVESGISMINAAMMAQTDTTNKGQQQT